MSADKKNTSIDSVSLLRKVFILLTVLIVLAVLLLIFQFTDVAFRVWDRLQNTPSGFLLVYVLGVIVIATLGILLIYRIWTVGRRKPTKKASPEPLRVEDVQARLEDARSKGIDVHTVDQDLAAVSDKSEPRELQIALFGKISTGKSSLIQTILPQAHIDISIIGGSTTRVERYSYTADSGLDLTLYDMPGTQQAEALPSMEAEVLEATRRVHVVLYILDQDLTASDLSAIKQLIGFAKPLIVVLNKSGQYEDDELVQLRERIVSRLPEGTMLVTSDSAYRREVTIRGSDGDARQETRLVGGEIDELLSALSNLGEQRAELGEQQRHALLSLADESLKQRVGKYRRERGEAMVKAYARKAMLGGVAAVGPGTDVIIQGYLGVDMMKSLTKLYDVSVKDVDLHALVETASSKVRSHLTVILALAGNVCKAFPGLGTVLGGASHAVAYGLVFESLGRATLTTLESSHEDFSDTNIMQHFEEQLHHDLEQRAKKLITTAISGRSERGSS
ncbi:50S ribosome-binding GTPase [Suttonella sp. R2A3]|uniref:GTPase n=1 Tax=Suttonella sp. R2A3 TaxID=2908648 RepID=UPI001F245EEC|nr:GTPase [Suttonella sp. R2A3]UJF24992.1 50S ribosome-binding GTPase [Suttonella sp. R2A3]